MRKIIYVCDKCHREIEGEPFTLLAVRQTPEGGYTADPDKKKRPDLCHGCMKLFQDFISPEALARRFEEEQQEKAPEEDAALEQQEPAEEPQEQEPAEEDAAKMQQEPKKKPVNEVDHGRIVALYMAKPPRSIKWIAEDCKCSQQTVINHLVKEGLYKVKKKETAEEE